MRRPILSLFILALAACSVYTQSFPEGMNYQAVLTNEDGSPYKNQQIDVRVELINSESSQDERLLYREEHVLKTNAYGLINIIIGEGRNTSRLEFKDVPWSKGNIWIRLSADTEQNGIYERVAETKLLSVPYAFHAKTADMISSAPSTTEDNSRSYYPTWQTTGNFGADPNYFFLGNLDAYDLVIRTNTLERMRILAGGGVNISDDLNVLNDVNVLNELNVSGLGLFNSDLQVSGNGLIGGFLNIQGEANFNGSLEVKFNSPTHVATFNNTNTMDGDGIAIKINAPKTYSENNYVTFMDGGDNVTGAIEGFDINRDMVSIPTPSTQAVKEAFCLYIDLSNPFTSNYTTIANALNIFSNSFNNAAISPIDFPNIPELSVGPIDLGIVTFPFTSIFDGLNLPDIPEFNFSDGIGTFPSVPLLSDFGCPTNGQYPALESYLQNLAFWGVENDASEFLTTSPGDLLLASTLWQLKREANDGGVSYSSKGADYAEWLEKEDPDKEFLFGQVVGVKGGKISLNTHDAEQVMSISLAPVVLGNTPSKDSKDKFEKVGFMGQVPVMLRGGCKSGDYILPSGKNDGYARSVPPGNLRVEEMHLVLGKALENSANDRVDMVNVLIGVKTNEWAEIFKQHDERISSLENTIGDLDFDAMEAKVEALKKELSNN